MNRISVKLLSAIAMIVFVIIIPIAVFAVNEDVSLVGRVDKNSNQEYILYIKDYSDKKFKYAFTTNANPEEMDLSYINSNPDLGGNQAALLDAATHEKLSKESSTIYMWAKDEKENLILKGIQLDLSEALGEEKLDQIETITNRIEVEIADSEADATTVRNETVNGVEQVANVGYVKIVDDDKKAKYYYERTKLPASEDYNELMNLVEEAQENYNKMDMYAKVQFAEKFDKTFTTVTDSAKWEEVEDKTIRQPEESKKDEQYIVLLKKVAKVDGKEVATLDVQFLTADDNYVPNVVVEEVIVQETTKLPITYDSIALFVALGIIVLLVIVVFIRMRKLSKQNGKK